jgi:hypothetical protein
MSSGGAVPRNLRLSFAVVGLMGLVNLVRKEVSPETFLEREYDKWWALGPNQVHTAATRGNRR